MSNEMIALAMILSWGFGVIVSTLILGRYHDKAFAEAKVILKKAHKDAQNAFTEGYRSALRYRFKYNDPPVCKEHTRLIAQYRQLKAISNQRKELIEFMSQFLTPEELDRVHHEKRGPKSSTRATRTVTTLDSLCKEDGA